MMMIKGLIKNFVNRRCRRRRLQQWRPLALPDRYIDHGSASDQLSEAGLTPSHIAASVFNVIGQRRDALKMMSLEK